MVLYTTNLQIFKNVLLGNGIWNFFLIEVINHEGL